jgi:hypothetical protein
VELVLDPALANKVDSLPEDGMGFHVVDFILHDGRVIREVVVLTGSVAIVPEGARWLSTADIADLRSSHP